MHLFIFLIYIKNARVRRVGIWLPPAPVIKPTSRRLYNDSWNGLLVRRHSSFTKLKRIKQISSMADRNEKMLLELLKRPGNNECADCGSKSKCL